LTAPADVAQRVAREHAGVAYGEVELGERLAVAIELGARTVWSPARRPGRRLSESFSRSPRVTKAPASTRRTIGSPRATRGGVPVRAGTPATAGGQPRSAGRVPRLV